MAIIKSGATSDEWTIDATSKAGRVSLYDSAGNDMSPKNVYSAALTAKTATAAGTGVFASIAGSSTKTIRVFRITVSGTVATTAVYGDVVVKKTSTATSSGTAVTLTQVPNDSSDPAGTSAAVNFYSTLATAGNLVGTLGIKSNLFPITATPVLIVPTVFDWTNANINEGPVLRGVSQCLELSFGTTTSNAPTLSVMFEWTEE